MKLTKINITILAFLSFIFIYTLSINFDITKQLNLVNLSIVLAVFILWITLGYLFLIKNIANSPERERNGIVLLLVILAILFFYYNPFPKPENFYVDLPRYIYFILTLITTLIILTLTWKNKIFALCFIIFIPLSIQSFLVNILRNSIYIDYTLPIIFTLTLILFTIKYIQREKE